MNLLFGYAPGRSPLHRLDPRPKALALAAGFLAAALFDAWWVLLAIIAATLALFLVSGAPASRLARRSRGIALFAALIFLAPVVFVREGRALWTPVEFAAWGRTVALSVTDAGLADGLAASLRFLAVVLMSALFVHTTDPARLAGALVRSGVPYRYAYSLVLALRFAPLFADESSQVQQAQRARGLAIDKGGVARPFRLARYTLTPLLASALGRVDAVASSMESRAFGRHPTRTFLRPSGMGAWDALAAAASLLLIGVVLAIRFGPALAGLA